MEIFATLGIIFAVTFLIEAFVEYFAGTPMDKIPKLTPYKWLLMYVAIAVSIPISFYYKFDLIALLGSFLEKEIAVSWVGIVLSGLAIGRGSNFLHQFVSKFFPAKS